MCDLALLLLAEIPARRTPSALGVSSRNPSIGSRAGRRSTCFRILIGYHWFSFIFKTIL
jgi:hypothetical protein